ncbi:MAG: sensor histidine kinase [Timaviella obliquedivisa GSE-PSE-MK23-08B]|jgi:signal transduction histidine kinase|nr:sensor histidine kinase [Timaviella obliquedivisa GSE-PSE-MK23-08B]
MTKFVDLAQPRFRLLHSVGAKLFFSVLGATLIALGSVSYLFYRALENRAKDEMMGRLNTQVGLVEGQITQAESYTIAFGVALQQMKALGITDAAAYKQATFEFFQKRPNLTMAIGAGQTPYQLMPDRQWIWHYFSADQELPTTVGQLLPAPNNRTRYTELFAEDNYPTQDYYLSITTSGKGIWTEPYYWYGVTMTSFMYPFYDNQKKMLGVIGTDINVTAIGKLTNIPVLSQGGYFAILSQEGKLLSYPPNRAKTQEQDYKAVPELEEVWQAAQSESQGLINSHGNLWAYQRVKGTDWLMIAVVPKRIILRPALVYMAVSAGGAGMILLLVVSMFVWHLNRRLQPILAECNHLRTADAERLSRLSPIAHQTIDSLPPINQAQDELGILIDTVHQVARQLHQSFTLLEENNEQLETRVQERTEELAKTLENLQETQSQLVQTEKMSSLGQMVAGIAHEINNPVNFIYGNLDYAEKYAQDLLVAIALYQKHSPSHPVIEQHLEKIELDYVAEDFPKLIASMQTGTQRIREIVVSLRNFSRLDDSMQPTNIHEGMDSTLLILKHRLTTQSYRSEIRVTKIYGDLPLVNCYAGLLNQVFMNLLANAIDVLEEDASQKNLQPAIHISTQAQVNCVVISIADNGRGMNEATKAKLFNAFFTTKPVGKGTGLGLSISRQIIVEKHGGTLDCISEPGQGTEFIITIPLQAEGSQTTTAVPVMG